jgi:ribokinase
MLGRVGADDHGRRMLTNLATVGCDVSAVRTVDGASGVAVIFVAESGQNCIAVVPGANHRYLPADLLEAEGVMKDAQFALLQLEIPLPTVVAAAQAARRQGAQVILDPAPASHSLPPELLQHVDILTPNETEAAQLVGETPGVLTREAAQNIARRLQAMGVKTVIVKLGPQGCLLVNGETATVIAAPRVAAVDTTAAGDVFNAALAVACSEGASLIDGCRFAVRAAALSVTRLGAQQSMPDRSAVDAAFTRE